MKHLLLSIFCLVYHTLIAQEIINLSNPSFEDIPALSRTTTGWFDCGFPGRSETDIHPVPDSDFEVTKPAKHGNTYLGMVVRSDGTYESIGQRLTSPLSGGKIYKLSVWLAKSSRYVSAFNNSPNEINFNTPVLFRIFGGNGYCEKAELLAVSSAVEHTDWQQYEFLLTPENTLLYINIEAFYDYDSYDQAYAGNVLVDDISPITEIDENNLASQSDFCFNLIENPVLSNQIKFHGIPGAPWRLVNDLGQTITEGRTQSGTNVIATDFLSAGLYFLVCKTNTLKIVVMK